MITAEKIASIKKRTRNGEPVGELRSELEADGFTKEEIAACFPAHSYDMSMWYLLFGCVLLIAAVVFISLLLAVGAAILYSLYYREIRNKEQRNKE